MCPDLYSEKNPLVRSSKTTTSCKRQLNLISAGGRVREFRYELFLKYPVKKIFVAISKQLLFVLLCDCNAVVNSSKFHEKKKNAENCFDRMLLLFFHYE